MNYYLIAKFIHIVGAFGFFVALGLEWTSLRHLQRATAVEHVREWMSVPNDMGRGGMIAMLVLVGAGFYMMATVWGWVAWIIVTLGALVLIILLWMMLSQRRMAAIGQALSKENGPIPLSLHQLLNDPLLSISIQIRVALALGIAFLMTLKPDLVGSLLTIGVAFALGLASAQRAFRYHQQMRERTAD